MFFLILHQEQGNYELVFEPMESLKALLCPQDQDWAQVLLGKKHSLMGLKVRQQDCQNKPLKGMAPTSLRIAL